MLLACARASFAQPGDDLCPCLGKVCFDIAEAKEIGDTLWSRLDDREKRRLAGIILLRQTEAARSAERERDQAREALAPLMESEHEARTGEALAKDDAMKWQMKARGRGSRGFIIGIGFGALATYGGYKGAQALGLVR